MIFYSFFFFFAPKVTYGIYYSILGNPGQLIIIIFYSSIACSPFYRCTIVPFNSLTEMQVTYYNIYVFRVYNSVFSIFREIQPLHTTVASQPVTYEETTWVISNLLLLKKKMQGTF